MLIQITQYLRPNGKQKRLLLDIPEEYRKQYDLILACECCITCEQLTTGQAVQYITHQLGDFAIETTPPHDKKAAEAALLQMIKSFNKTMFETWLARVNAEEEDETIDLEENQDMRLIK